MAVGQSVEDVAAMSALVDQLVNYSHVIRQHGKRVTVEIDMPQSLFDAICALGAADEDLEEEPIEREADMEPETVEDDGVWF